MPLQTAKILEKKQFTNDVVELTFETSTPFNFQAGQFVTIKIDDKVPPCFRAYSIASAPKENTNKFSTCLKIVDNGRGSNWLNALEIGQPISFIGPSGKFLFKGEKKSAIFVATGTGITPFTAMIEDQLLKGNKQNLHLLFGLRFIKSIFYKELLEGWAQKYSNFTFNITLTKPENDSWKGTTGRVTDILRSSDIDVNNTEVYICGLKVMIEEVVAILKEKGMPQESIHFEKYD